MSLSSAETFARKLYEAMQYAEQEIYEDKAFAQPWHELDSDERQAYYMVAVGILPWLRGQFATKVESQRENCYADDAGEAAKAAYADAARIIRKMTLTW